MGSRKLKKVISFALMLSVIFSLVTINRLDVYGDYEEDFLPIVAIDGSIEGFSHSLAIREDGSVWAWGGNVYGQLGDGTTLNRTTPVQVKGTGGEGYLTDPIIFLQPEPYSLIYKGQLINVEWMSTGSEIVEYQLMVGYASEADNLISVKTIPAGLDGEIVSYQIDTATFPSEFEFGLFTISVRAKYSNNVWTEWATQEVILLTISMQHYVTVIDNYNFEILLEDTNGLYLPRNYSPTQNGITAVDLQGEQIGNSVLLTGKFIGNTNGQYVEFNIDGFNSLYIKVIPKPSTNVQSTFY